MTRKKPPPTTSLAAAEYLTFVAASGGGGVEAVEFEKYRIVQDRLFESDFGRIEADTK